MKATRTHETKGVLVKHCGFTDEELDFIPSTLLRAGINYDIRYRMGQDVGGANE
jgi:hypothetical protein